MEQKNVHLLVGLKIFSKTIFSSLLLSFRPYKPAGRRASGRAQSKQQKVERCSTVLAARDAAPSAAAGAAGATALADAGAAGGEVK